LVTVCYSCHGSPYVHLPRTDGFTYRCCVCPWSLYSTRHSPALHPAFAYPRHEDSLTTPLVLNASTTIPFPDLHVVVRALHASTHTRRTHTAACRHGTTAHHFNSFPASAGFVPYSCFNYCTLAYVVLCGQQRHAVVHVRARLRHGDFHTPYCARCVVTHIYMDSFTFTFIAAACCIHLWGMVNIACDLYCTSLSSPVFITDNAQTLLTLHSSAFGCCRMPFAFSLQHTFAFSFCYAGTSRLYRILYIAFLHFLLLAALLLVRALHTFGSSPFAAYGAQHRIAPRLA